MPSSAPAGHATSCDPSTRSAQSRITANSGRLTNGKPSRSRTAHSSRYSCQRSSCKRRFAGINVWNRFRGRDGRRRGDTARAGAAPSGPAMRLRDACRVLFVVVHQGCSHRASSKSQIVERRTSDTAQPSSILGGQQDRRVLVVAAADVRDDPERPAWDVGEDAEQHPLPGC